MRRLGLLAGTAACLLAAGPALAQGVVLDDIVVTAQKREGDIQRTALAITAVTGDTLGRQGVINATDLQGLAPGVNFVGGATSMNVAIRGVTSTGISSSVATDPAVSVFIDGVVTARQNSASGVLYDLQRVEVLRGPQGTLWGRNNTAGAINFVTSRPSDRYEGRIALDLGNYDAISVEGAVNLPISDALALRASVRTVRHDAYFDNGYGDQDDVAARVKLLWRPSDDLDVLATVDYLHNGGKGATSSVYPPGALLTPALPSGTAWRPWSGLPLCTGPYPSSPTANTCIATDGSIDDTNIGAYLEINLRLDWATLTYLPGYRRVESDDLRYVGSGFTRQEVHQIDEWQSHELRLASTAGSRISWVVGLYYYNEEFSGLSYNYPQNGGYSYSSTPDATSKSIAAFGQLTYPVTDALRLTLGLRQTHDEKESIGQGNYVVAGRGAAAPATRAIFSPRGEWDQTNYKIGVEYDLTPTSMLYADVSTGYKAGGFFNAYANNTFEPEKVTAFQAGAKNRLFGNTVQANVDVFYYDYRNYQVSTAVTAQFNAPPAGPSFGLVTLNSQKARYYGLEAEGRWAITAHDRLEGSLSLLNAEWTQFRVTGLNLSGFRPTFAPAVTARLAYEHTLDLPGGAALTGRIQTVYSDDYRVYFSHLPGSRQEAYTKTDVSLTYASPDRQWEVVVAAPAARAEIVAHDVDIVLDGLAKDSPFKLGDHHNARIFYDTAKVDPKTGRAPMLHMQHMKTLVPKTLDPVEMPMGNSWIEPGASPILYHYGATPPGSTSIYFDEKTRHLYVRDAVSGALILSGAYTVDPKALKGGEIDAVAGGR